LKTSRKDPKKSSRRISLRVPKKLGEKAVRTLANLKLIDRDFRIESSKVSLFIPLAKRPGPAELRDLKDEFGAAVLTEHSFHRKVSRPRNLVDALKDRLPRGLLKDLPSSYDIIGDIAVLDLPASLSSYESVLANGIQEVNKNVRVVLAKAGAIMGVERILPTRHLAGENRTETLQRESGCLFKVDIAQAYYSPRLSHEHERVVRQVESGEVVTDLFAGVGPFSIMIAKKLEAGEVNAVDSNPAAINLLRENLILNRVQGRLNVWLGDAREVVEKNLAGKASRVIMNHPSAARDFVDVACNALRKEGGTIHYYTFAEGLNCEDRAMAEFEGALENCNWRTRWLAQVRRVRGVAPMRWQVVVDAPVAPVS